MSLVAEEKAEPAQAMNALMRLNQLKPGLQYKLVSQTGPVHAPIFTMSVEVDGNSFEASGPSKKTAKLHVAVKVSGRPGAGLYRCRAGDAWGSDVPTPGRAAGHSLTWRPGVSASTGVAGHGSAHGRRRQGLEQGGGLSRGDRAEARRGGPAAGGGDRLHA